MLRAGGGEGLGQSHLQYWSTWWDAAQGNKPSQQGKRTEILQAISSSKFQSIDLTCKGNDLNLS